MSNETSWALDLERLVGRADFLKIPDYSLQTLLLLMSESRRMGGGPFVRILGGLDHSFRDLERLGWLTIPDEGAGVILTEQATSLLVSVAGRVRVSPVAVGQTRGDALAVACPECGAGAGFSCIGKRRGGAARAAPHAARYAAARGA